MFTIRTALLVPATLATILLFFFLHEGRGDGSCNTIRMTGPLSQDMVDEIETCDGRVRHIIIDSPGGHGLIAAEISKYIRSNDVRLSVKGQCSSACFEFIASATGKVRMIGRPVIALHGSPLVLEEMLERSGQTQAEHCPRMQLQEQIAIYEQNELSFEFPAVQLEALGIEVFETRHVEGGCQKHRFKFSNKFWYPTSVQIEELLGLEIIGSICADSVDCAKKYLIKSNGQETCILEDSEIPC